MHGVERIRYSFEPILLTSFISFSTLLKYFIKSSDFTEMVNDQKSNKCFLKAIFRKPFPKKYLIFIYYFNNNFKIVLFLLFYSVFISAQMSIIMHIMQSHIWFSNKERGKETRPHMLK